MHWSQSVGFGKGHHQQIKNLVCRRFTYLSVSTQCYRKDTFAISMDCSKTGIKKWEQLIENFIGTGVFGDVFQAVGNETFLCAAKIIHPNLIKLEEEERKSESLHRVPIDTLLPKIKLLADLNHPNIVLFLGVSRHPKSRLPVVLTEYMDDNLTQYLAMHHQPLPFQTEFTWTCNVAMGLAHLHYNDIAHGDLSSNNVLISGGSVAKIADSGMADIFKGTLSIGRKKEFNSAYVPISPQTPGPKLDFKTDVFSLGVLIVQILTREVPCPDGKAATEISRRHNHISLISKNHPLLNVLLRCLGDNSKKRPDMLKVCKDLTNLKASRFTQPLNANGHSDSTATSQEKRAAPEPELSTDAEQCNEDFVVLEMPVLPLAPPTPTPVKSKNLGATWKLEKCHGSQFISRTSDAAYDGSFMYMLCGLERSTVLMLGPMSNNNIGELFDTDLSWTQLEPAKLTNSTLAMAGSDLVTVGGCSGQKPSNKLFKLCNLRWQATENPMPTSRYDVTVSSYKWTIIVAGGRDSSQRFLRIVEVLDTENEQWYAVSSLPVPAAYYSSCVVGEEMWIAGPDNNVFCCNLEVLESSAEKPSLFPKPVPTGAWQFKAVPICATTLVAIDNSLYAIGGKSADGMKTTDAIYEYSRKKREWYVVSHMKMPRCDCLAVAVSNQKRLVVVGGISESGSTLNSVESGYFKASLDAKL